MAYDLSNAPKNLGAENITTSGGPLVAGKADGPQDAV